MKEKEFIHIKNTNDYKIITTNMKIDGRFLQLLLDKTDPERLESNRRWIDLELPSGTLWCDKNEDGYFTYNEAIKEFNNRIPSYEQCNELIKECIWQWNDDKYGYNVIGKNGNSIFLPAEDFNDIDRYTNKSTYWLSTNIDEAYSWNLHLQSKQKYFATIALNATSNFVRLIKNK